MTGKQRKKIDESALNVIVPDDFFFVFFFTSIFVKLFIEAFDSAHPDEEDPHRRTTESSQSPSIGR